MTPRSPSVYHILPYASSALTEKNQRGVEANVQQGVGGLLLLAAAQETGWLSQLETAIASCEPTTPRSLLSSSPHCLRQLMLTLLFLPLSGLRRTHDLRGYSGDALAVLTGRHRAYGYCHTERFLSQLAKAEGAEALTTALGSWTTQLWKAGSEGGNDSMPDSLTSWVCIEALACFQRYVSEFCREEKTILSLDWLVKLIESFAL